MQGDGEVLDPMSKDEESDDVAVARFLRTCPGLSKSIVGDLLGQNNERCLRILDSFTHMFDFSGRAILRDCENDLESASRCLCELVHLTPRAHSPSCKINTCMLRNTSLRLEGSCAVHWGCWAAWLEMSLYAFSIMKGARTLYALSFLCATLFAYSLPAKHSLAAPIRG